MQARYSWWRVVDCRVLVGFLEGWLAGTASLAGLEQSRHSLTMGRRMKVTCARCSGWWC